VKTASPGMATAGVLLVAAPAPAQVPAGDQAWVYYGRFRLHSNQVFEAGTPSDGTFALPDAYVTRVSTGTYIEWVIELTDPVS
jgi:hypothetical protein